MTTKTENIVATESATMDSAVVKLLDSATKSANSAQQGAREAAKLAFKAPVFIGTANRLAALLELYRDKLSNDVVKQAFSNALAVLCAGEPVRIAASSKSSENMAGKLTLVAPNFLAKGEVADPEKSLITLTPEKALDKLSKEALTAAAKVAREEMGIARKEGGGRKAGAGNKDPKTPSFKEQLEAMLDNEGGRTLLENMLLAKGYTLHKVRAAAKMEKEAKASASNAKASDTAKMAAQIVNA